MNFLIKLDFAVIRCYYSVSDKWKVESFPTLPNRILSGIIPVPTPQVSAFPFVAIWEALRGGLFYGQGGEKVAMSDLIATYIYECVECHKVRHESRVLLKMPWRCVVCWWDIRPKVHRLKDQINSRAKRIIKERGGKCEECNTDKKRMVVHHVLPINWGGDNAPENLQVLCQPCHKLKHPGGTKWYEGATHEAAGLIEIQYRERLIVTDSTCFQKTIARVNNGR